MTVKMIRLRNFGAILLAIESVLALFLYLFVSSNFFHKCYNLVIYLKKQLAYSLLIALIFAYNYIFTK